MNTFSSGSAQISCAIRVSRRGAGDPAESGAGAVHRPRRGPDRADDSGALQGGGVAGGRSGRFLTRRRGLRIVGEVESCTGAPRRVLALQPGVAAPQPTSWNARPGSLNPAGVAV